jgi:hypothetical protein
MQDGIARLMVLRAMLFYLLAHFQPLNDEGSPTARHICLVNTEIHASVRPLEPSSSLSLCMAAESG